MALHLRKQDGTSDLRLWRNAGALAVVITMGVTAVAASDAQAAADTGWRSACRDLPSERICVISQSLHDHDGRMLARLRLQPQGASGVMQVLLPMGVHLGSGVFYALDGGQEQALRYQRCQNAPQNAPQNAQCEASAAIAKPQWQALLKARDIDLIYRPDAGSPPRRLRLALQGLDAALQNLNQEAAP